MKTLQVLGTGCPTCKKLAEMVEEAARELALDFELVKVSNIDEIAAFDIAATPALAVDGEVKVAGRLPKLDEIKEMIA